MADQISSTPKKTVLEDVQEEQYEKVIIIPPCKSDEVVSIVLDHDKLLNYLTYLKKTDETVFTHLKEIFKSLTILNEYGERIDELELKAQSHTLLFEGINNTLDEYNTIFEKHEKRFDTLGEEIKTIIDNNRDGVMKINTLELESREHSQKNAELDKKLINVDNYHKEKVGDLNLVLSKLSTQVTYGVLPDIEKANDEINKLDGKNREIEERIKTVVNLEDQFKKFSTKISGEVMVLYTEVIIILILTAI